jgi:hypothetical protein
MTRKKKRKSFNYFVLFPLLVIFSVLVFFNLKLWNERKIVREQLQKIEADLLRAEEEARTFEKREDIDIEEEIERVAREQLLLKKEGESVIVISREEETEQVEIEEEEEKGFFESLIEIFQTE